MKMNFEGIITSIGKEETVGQNNLRKVTIVIEEDNDKEYKSSIAVAILGDKVDMIKDFNTGDKVVAHLNCKVKEGTNGWWNSINAWRLDKIDGSAPAAKAATPAENDDLPF